MLNEFYYPGLPEIMFQLTLAVLLGASVGIERELAQKTAGMRTYALVCLGSALFTIISTTGFTEFEELPGYDPSRIASQVLVGIGFIGAGIIFFRKDKERVMGLTTAASVWVVSAIGMSIGLRLYSIAAFTTILIFFILIVLWWVETKLIRPLAEKDNRR